MNKHLHYLGVGLLHIVVIAICVGLVFGGTWGFVWLIDSHNAFRIGVLVALVILFIYLVGWAIVKDREKTGYEP